MTKVIRDQQKSKLKFSLYFSAHCIRHVPIPVAERSKMRSCGRWLAGIAGSNPAGDMGICLLLMFSVVR